MMITTHGQRAALGAIALTATVFAAGCSSSGKTGTPATHNGPAGPGSAAASAQAGSTTAESSTTAATTITIKDFAYQVTGPAKPGSKITVTNKDNQAHTVTADADKAFDATVPGGKTVTFTAPARSGTYKFHCTYHANMHGSLTVK